MKCLPKALLACGLLACAASVFLPWSTSHTIGGAGITYWTFKARIYPYPYPDFLPPYEKRFFDFWSWRGYWAIIFLSQMLTLLFGLLTFLKKSNGKYRSVCVWLTLLFSAVPIGTFILHTFQLSRTFMINSTIGFWTASFAFLFLTASLLTSLKKQRKILDKIWKKKGFSSDITTISRVRPNQFDTSLNPLKLIVHIQDNVRKTSQSCWPIYKGGTSSLTCLLTSVLAVSFSSLLLVIEERYKGYVLGIRGGAFGSMQQNVRCNGGHNIRCSQSSKFPHV